MCNSCRIFLEGEAGEWDSLGLSAAGMAFFEDIPVKILFKSLQPFFLLFCYIVGTNFSISFCIILFCLFGGGGLKKFLRILGIPLSYDNVKSIETPRLRGLFDAIHKFA